MRRRWCARLAAREDRYPFNWNDTIVTDHEQTISDGRKREIEDALPDTRTTFTVSHPKGAFSGLLRINYYDETYESLFNDPNLPLVTDPLVIVDAELGWDFDDTFSSCCRCEEPVRRAAG